MRELIDSGIEWLGVIPKNWKYGTLRQFVVNREGGAWGDEPNEDESGMICLRVADFDYSLGRFKNVDPAELTYRVYSKGQERKLVLQKGDILIEKSGGGDKTPVGRAVLFDKEYSALFANFMERLRFNSDVIEPAYVELWLRAWYSCRCSSYYINQTTGIQNLNLSLMLAKERIYYPNKTMQLKIVQYLLLKTSKIEKLQEKIRDQIATLEKLKQSVVYEAVTKGVAQDVPLKDSAIEWVGMIPEHWDVLPNKYIMKKVKNICPSYNGEDILSLTMNGVIVRDLSAGGKMPATFDGYQRVSPGNLLMCLFDIDVTPRCIGLIKQSGLTSPAYSQFVMKSGAYAPYYYYYYLMVDHTKELLHMAKNLRHSLTEDQLGTINTPMPPYLEQVSIADYLDKKCQEIDRIVEKKNKLYSILDDYKKALIFEYVTGKKEVPCA